MYSLGSHMSLGLLTSLSSSRRNGVPHFDRLPRDRLQHRCETVALHQVKLVRVKIVLSRGIIGRGEHPSRKRARTSERPLMRRCPVLARASSAAVTTTLHKDGTVTYHFTSDLLLQAASPQQLADDKVAKAVNFSEESSPANGHTLYEDMHARVSAAVAGIDTALLSLDKDGYGSEHSVDALRTAATGTASENNADYVPEEDLGPVIGADGIQIPRAALLKIRESQRQRDLLDKTDSSATKSIDREVQHQSESAPGAKPAGQQHVGTEHESFRRLLQHENMQKADALHMLQLFSDSCASGKLGGALQILEAAVKARRDDIVRR